MDFLVEFKVITEGESADIDDCAPVDEHDIGTMIEASKWAEELKKRRAAWDFASMDEIDAELLRDDFTDRIEWLERMSDQ